MGQVGGNGSVVWMNQHRTGNRKFKEKNGSGKLERDELRLGGALDVTGRDDVPFNDIGTTQATPGVGGVMAPTGLQERGYFLVRLRFDGPQAAYIQTWFAATGTAIPPNVAMYSEGNSTILAVKVKAINRPWPGDDISWTEMPWEIRYDY